MDDLLTAQDLKKILKCSLPLVYKLAEKRKIPSVRFNTEGTKESLRFKKEDVLQFIENHYKK